MISGFSDCCINLYWRELLSAEICSNTFLFGEAGPHTLPERGTLRRTTASEDTLVIRILFLYMRFDIHYYLPNFANFILFMRILGITPFGVRYLLQLIRAKSGSN